jgi:hypothetical protein
MDPLQNQPQFPPGYKPEPVAPVKKVNPLSNWFRQPKIYVRLPSDGEFYPPGALDKSENGEYAVYAMTARDELMMKTPDALLSGQSTVEVIKSCIPSIVDPWSMPGIDLDCALLSIRIATYGEKMEVGVNCPHCEEENHYDVDLLNWLEKMRGFHYVQEIPADPLTIYVRPYSYKEITKTSLKTFEQQRLINIVNDEKISDEEKIKQFGESFVKLTAMTVDVIAECIWKIATPDGETTDRDHINEFINNVPKVTFDKISDHIAAMKSKIELGNQNVKCAHCSTDFEMPVQMDQSNFFAPRS